MVQMDVFEKFYKDMIKFDQYLGMNLKVHEPGKITYTLELNENHSTTPDQVHGGVISAMMDAVLGLTALTLAVSNNNFCSTVEYKLNFLSTAKPGETIEGSAEIDFAGSTIICTSGTIREQSSGRIIAKGMGTFQQYPIAKKKDVLKAAGMAGKRE